jgi:hypothetical protein
MLVVQVLTSVGVGLIATALFGWTLDRKSRSGEEEPSRIRSQSQE